MRDKMSNLKQYLVSEALVAEKRSEFNPPGWEDPSVKAVSTRKLPVMKGSTAKVFKVTDKEMGVKDPVYAIKNDTDVIDGLVELLGAPVDGTPYKVRTGFMVYDAKNKMLFFGKNKSDLPIVK